LSHFQNVSIIFADEPTSGLDASAAAVVMRGLKRIAQSGRAVCCTIHQPSIAIFNDFDELLLLKRGGETVFFGELGAHSSLLIKYLESFDATPKIHPGENPATWMLTTTGAGSSSSNIPPFDYVGSYARSALRQKCIERIDSICADASEEKKIEFSNEYATSKEAQASAVFSRTLTVYYRSPSYNVTRVMVAIVGKFRMVAQCVVISKFSFLTKNILVTVSLLFGSG
jgi:ABC-type multidrug transport system ATPase subunit